MRQFLVVLLFVAVAFCQSPPTWPSTYTATGVIRLPYGYGINQPFSIWFDNANNRARMDYFDGMDSYIYRGDLKTDYMIIPRINQKVCFSGPQQAGETLTTVLPDISSWSYIGSQTLLGRQCDAFQSKVTNFNKTATYTFYVEQKVNRPVRLLLQGYDFLFGSHPDLYIIDYQTYFPGFVDANMFEVPSLCQNSATDERLVARTNALRGILHHMVTPQVADDKFGSFSIQYKKAYSQGEFEKRQFNYQQNMETIESINSRNHLTFTTKMNHFGDLSFEEFKNFMLPTKNLGKTKQAFQYTHSLPEPTPEQLAALPQSIDWREHNAVTMIKDQGICGSCWTFGTIGSLEGVYAAKTGVLIPLSEQQLVDCAWVDWIMGTNSGCDGGFAPSAFEWLIQNGGVALEDEYKYLMVDGWCHADRQSSGVVVKGYVNVTSGSEAALQYAVATVGPVAIAIDAAHPEFVYYDSGVYYNPKCGNTLDDLDHEVLVVGYGVDPVGGDYWIVKNSWSTYWGDQGYIKMARNKGNNCGIATQATYPIV